MKCQTSHQKIFPRHLRIANQIQKDLSKLITLALKDPRIGMVTITEVDLTPDYSHAKIYFTRFDLQKEGTIEKMGTAQQTTEGLTAAAGFLRRELGRVLKIHKIPQLYFIYDHTIVRGANLSRLIDEANATSSEEERI